MKVVFHSTPGVETARRFAELAGDGLVIESCPESDRDRFRALLADVDVIWHVLEPITAAHIEAAPRLRLIQKIGVGVNTIDLDAASQRGIAVCNMPGTNTQAVAELTLMLMLMALRRAHELDVATRAGRWIGDGLTTHLQDHAGELHGRTVGLVGYGAVPRRLAPVLTTMGARVVYTARQEPDDAVGIRLTLDALLAESDIVSLHVPLTSETDGMIDAGAIGRMKQGAVLVNTARGTLVDEAALRAALEGGRLAAAGLDVFSEEPLPATVPILALPNVVVTPHVAYLTRETIARSLAVAAENCRRLAGGEELLHRVV